MKAAKSGLKQRLRPETYFQFDPEDRIFRSTNFIYDFIFNDLVPCEDRFRPGEGKQLPSARSIIAKFKVVFVNNFIVEAAKHASNLHQDWIVAVSGIGKQWKAGTTFHSSKEKWRRRPIMRVDLKAGSEIE